jgi:hypothetical protein
MSRRRVYRLYATPLGRLLVAGLTLLLVAVQAGCSEDAPVDEPMRAANDTVFTFCFSYPGKQPAPTPTLRAALRRIAEREQADPDGRFRIDDSDDPMTAQEMLDGLASYAREPRANCDLIPAEIRRARAAVRAG